MAGVKKGDLIVTVFEARGIKNGESANSTCMLSLVGGKSSNVKQTTQYNNSSDPRWSEQVYLPLNAWKDEVLVEVWDQQKFTKAFLGQVQIPFLALKLDRNPQWYTLTNKPTPMGADLLKNKLITGELLVKLDFLPPGAAKPPALARPAGAAEPVEPEPVRPAPAAVPTPSPVVAKASPTPSPIASPARPTPSTSPAASPLAKPPAPGVAAAKPTPATTPATSVPKPAATPPTASPTGARPTPTPATTPPKPAATTPTPSTTPVATAKPTPSPSPLAKPSPQLTPMGRPASPSPQPAATPAAKAPATTTSTATPPRPAAVPPLVIAESSTRPAAAQEPAPAPVEDAGEAVGFSKAEQVMIEEALSDKKRMIQKELTEKRELLRIATQNIEKKATEKGRDSVREDLQKLEKLKQDLAVLEAAVQALEKEQARQQEPKTPRRERSKTSGLLAPVAATGGQSSREEDDKPSARASARDASSPRRERSRTSGLNLAAPAPVAVMDENTAELMRTIATRLQSIEKNMDEEKVRMDREMKRMEKELEKERGFREKQEELEQARERTHQMDLKMKDMELRVVELSTQLELERRGKGEELSKVDVLQKKVRGLEEDERRRRVEMMESDPSERAKVTQRLMGERLMDLVNGTAALMEQEASFLQMTKEFISQSGSLDNLVQDLSKAAIVGMSHEERSQIAGKRKELERRFEELKKEIEGLEESLVRKSIRKRQLLVELAEKKRQRMHDSLRVLDKQHTELIKRLEDEDGKVFSDSEEDIEVALSDSDSSDGAGKQDPARIQRKQELQRKKQEAKNKLAQAKRALRAERVGRDDALISKRQKEVALMEKKLGKVNKALEKQKQRKQALQAEAKGLNAEEEPGSSDYEFSDDDESSGDEVAAKKKGGEDMFQALAAKLQKLDKLDDLLLKLSNLSVGAVVSGALPAGGKRTAAEIKGEIEELQKVLMDPNATPKQIEDTNIKLEKAMEEWERTEEFKQEMRAADEEKRKKNEPLNKSALDELMPIFSKPEEELPTDLQDKIKKWPELRLIGMDHKNILAKHQNDFKYYLLRGLEIKELRAIRASLPKFRNDQKKQQEWVEILDKKIDEWVDKPPPPPKPVANLAGGPPPPPKKLKPKPAKAAAGASSGDMFAELLARRKAIDVD